MCYYINSFSEKIEIKSFRVFRADPKKNKCLNPHYRWIGIMVNNGDYGRFYPVEGRHNSAAMKILVRNEFNVLKSGNGRFQ